LRERVLQESLTRLRRAMRLLALRQALADYRELAF
jgi:hypothetical protein